MTAFVYRAAVSAYFFDDDFQWLVGTWAFTPRQLIDVAHLRHFYRPIIDLYFAAATPLFGGSPELFHVANIALHALNGLILLALARAISGSAAFGFLTALFFVVQPGDIDAVAWVSALAEPVSAFFGLLALLWFVRFRQRGSAVRQALSVVALALALLTHESSVVFVALIVIADWAFFNAFTRSVSEKCEHAPGGDARTRTSTVQRYAPYAVVTIIYLAIDLQINSRNYVVTQGHYGIGRHVVVNALDYLTALYVGRGDIANYALVAAGVVALLLEGSRRVVFATSWMVLALLPFVFFTWSNTSRYLYLPAMGFSMLVAESVLWIDRILASRVTPAARRAVIAVVVAAIAGRFTVFAVRNVKAFAQRAESYRQYIALFREIHGQLPRNSRVAPDARLSSNHGLQFLTPLVQWEYKDATIELIPDQPTRE
jgi:hypothetical protein